MGFLFHFADLLVKFELFSCMDRVCTKRSGGRRLSVGELRQWQKARDPSINETNF